MVLPLQTWQYSQPKRLWPLLGGLSVLAHVGVLGLSLPYVLELMEPVGDRASSSSTPVELIVVDEPAQSVVPLAEQPTVDEDPSASEAPSASANLKASRPVRASADSRPSVISPTEGITSPSSATPAASDAVQPQAPSTNDSVGSNSSDDATARQATQSNPPLSAQETAQATPPVSESSPQSPTGSVSQTEESSQSEESSQPEDSQPEESSQSGGAQSGGAQSEELTDEFAPFSASIEANGSLGQDENSAVEPSQVVEGEQLPAPGTTLDEAGPQVAALQVVGTDLNTVQDRKDVPPKWVEASGAITLQPESLGCGDVDFAEGRLTYRLAINADSTLRTVTPFPLDERRSVQAVACLIESAGFQFEAAISEGVPVLDDSLLMTVQVIESQME